MKFTIPVSNGDFVDISCEETFEVFLFGSKKHNGKGFESGTISISKHFYAALRHLWKWFFRFPPDEETGRSHLAHAHCRILMMIYQEQRNLNDDRLK